MGIDYGLVGRRVSACRKANRKTQENVAEHLAVSVGYISQIERGVTKVSLDTLSKIAGYLQCDVAELITHTERDQDRYLSEELSRICLKMDAGQKRMFLELAEVILRYQPDSER